MIIASYNVNGIKARLNTLIAWLKSRNPDIVVLQEIKTTDETFPRIEIEDLGYNLVTHGQKSFNGVAILSKYPIEFPKKGLGNSVDDSQSRWIEAEINSIRVCGLYLPNGNPCPGPKFDYKLDWMIRFYNRAAEIIENEEAAILLGDYNIIPQWEDAQNPNKWVNDALFHSKSRATFQKLLNLGYTDALKVCNQGVKEFTFWDYQKASWQKNDGIRIDHLLLTPHVADRLKDCATDSYLRGENSPSDHVPVWLQIEA